jgi:hypothetical protein
MRRRGLRGAIASRRASGIEDGALGSLETHEDAQRWLRLIGEAVVTGNLTDKAATAGVKAVEAWVRTEAERATAEVVGDLRKEVERLKTEMKRGRPIEAVR